MVSDVTYTSHAIKRAKERLNIDSIVLLESFVAEAWASGVWLSSIKGSIGIELRNRLATSGGNNMLLYKDVVLVWHNRRLITIYKLSGHKRKESTKYQRQKRHGDSY